MLNQFNVTCLCNAMLGYLYSYSGTALHYAAYGGHTAVIEQLLKHGTDLHSKGNDGYNVCLMLK